MKEGELFLGASDTVPRGSFLLAQLDHAPTKGEGIPNKDLLIIYASQDFSLADRLAIIGISRKLNMEGINVILITNEDDNPQFG